MHNLPAKKQVIICVVAMILPSCSGGFCAVWAANKCKPIAMLLDRKHIGRSLDFAERLQKLIKGHFGAEIIAISSKSTNSAIQKTRWTQWHLKSSVSLLRVPSVGVGGNYECLGALLLRRGCHLTAGGESATCTVTNQYIFVQTCKSIDSRDLKP